MSKFILLSEMVEPNGKTIRENNLEIKHTIPLNTLVELETGARVFVCQRTRDCDGTPLYCLHPEPCKCAEILKSIVDDPELEERYPQDFRIVNGHFKYCPHKDDGVYDRFKWLMGYRETSLTVIK
jgi:hypothetical protein